ncbi:DMT family transporter [Halosolutus gelatinilyticus]|uniref:DMT family transporter n=1 Tax=Halosolutus gelatinilyticus TaxID=2931975 RepID=UPI001FF389FE|nr:DMT family transporter [Halosolutus gelatinilyticus]
MRYRTPLLFLLVAAIWGTTFPAVRAAVAVVPPVLFAALRFDATAILILGYAAVRGDRVRPRREEWAGLVAGGVLLIACHHALLFAGQQYVTSAVAAVVVATIPILTAGLSRLVLPTTSLGVVGAVGLGLGFIGTAIVADPDPGDLYTSESLGVVIIFAAALAFALGTVATQRTRTDLPVASLQGWLMLLGAPVLHVASRGLGEPQAIGWTPTVLLAFAYLVPVAGALGYLLYFDLLDRLGSVEINLVSYLLPVFAAVVGWLALDESPAATTIVGFAVVAVGFALIKRTALVRLVVGRRRGASPSIDEPVGEKE